MTEIIESDVLAEIVKGCSGSYCTHQKHKGSQAINRCQIFMDVARRLKVALAYADSGLDEDQIAARMKLSHAAVNFLLVTAGSQKVDAHASQKEAYKVYCYRFGCLLKAGFPVEIVFITIPIQESDLATIVQRFSPDEFANIACGWGGRKACGIDRPILSTRVFRNLFIEAVTTGSSLDALIWKSDRYLLTVWGIGKEGLKEIKEARRFSVGASSVPGKSVRMESA